MNNIKKITLFTLIALGIQPIAFIQAYDRTKYAAETKILLDRLHELSQQNDPDAQNWANSWINAVNNNSLNDHKFLGLFNLVKDKDSLELLEISKGQQTTVTQLKWFTVAAVGIIACILFATKK